MVYPLGCQMYKPKISNIKNTKYHIVCTELKQRADSVAFPVWVAPDGVWGKLNCNGDDQVLPALQMPGKGAPGEGPRPLSQGEWQARGPA